MAIENLIPKLDLNQTISLVKGTNPLNMNKIVGNLETAQIKDLVGNIDAVGIRKIIDSSTGDTLARMKSVLDPSEIAMIGNDLPVNLKDKFNLPIDQLSGKFNLPTDITAIAGIGGIAAGLSQSTQDIISKLNVPAGQIQDFANSLEGLPENLNFDIGDLSEKLGMPIEDLASKLQITTDLTSKISLPKVDLFGIIEALDIPGVFELSALAGALLTIQLPNPADIASQIKGQIQGLADSVASLPSQIESAATAAANEVKDLATSVANEATSIANSIESSAEDITQQLTTLKNDVAAKFNNDNETS